MSTICGVCGTRLYWPRGQENPSPCPTCARHKFMEERLLDNMEVMKEIRLVLKQIVTIMEHKRHGEKEG